MLKSTFVGRTARVGEVKTIKLGERELSQVYFTVATNRNYKQANGERKTDFIPCRATGALADVAREYLALYDGNKKLISRLVEVSGHLEMYSTTREVSVDISLETGEVDAQGNPVSVIETIHHTIPDERFIFVVTDIVFHDSLNKEGRPAVKSDQPVGTFKAEKARVAVVANPPSTPAVNLSDVVESIEDDFDGLA